LPVWGTVSGIVYINQNIVSDYGIVDGKLVDNAPFDKIEFYIN
jgi:hypothetical protein